MSSAPPTTDPVSARTATPSKEILLTRILTCGFFAVIAFTLIVPFFSSLSWTTLVQDDFFYYLVVAQNVVHGHGSTFNGIVATNGYQPLWFACIVAFSFFTTNARVILGFVALTSFAASGATFALSNKLFRSTGVRPLLAFVFSAWLVATSLALFCMGMEVTLAIPLVVAVGCALSDFGRITRSPLHAFYLGLLLAAMVLARIDTIILTAILCIGVLASKPLRTSINFRTITAVVCGFLPAVLYFISNRVYFHTWLPISGMAKQLKLDHHLSSLPFQAFREQISGSVKLSVLFIALSIILLPKLFPRLSSIQRVTLISLLIYPFIYYPTLSFLSDWPLWAWYWYAIRLAFLASLALFCLSPLTRYWLQKPIVLALLILAVFLQVSTHPWKRDDFDIDDTAIRTRDFAATHPGIYAMGDRAGTVAYLLPYPVVQLEGLMMDRHFLDLLRVQVPLRQVMAEYHVRYYIATAFDDQPCFVAVEPRLGGPHVAHMRDQFCEPPALRFTSFGKTTLIYDLGPQH